jgi:tetratricopeptide (TPR) repeat protein
MKSWMTIMVVVILASVLGFATDTQFDKAKLASMSASELASTADNLRSQKDYEGSQRLFEEATRKQPNDPSIWDKLGIVDLQLRQYGSAGSHFKKALKLNPNFAYAWNNLGVVYFLQNHTDKAIKYYRKALALDEGRATYHVNLAAAWERQRKLNLALAEYGRALELDPAVFMNSSTTGVAAQVLTAEDRANRYFLVAKVFAMRGDLDSTIEFLKKAKEEGYRDMRSVYKQQEFAKLWSDPRLNEIVPPSK